MRDDNKNNAQNIGDAPDSNVPSTGSSSTWMPTRVLNAPNVPANLQDELAKLKAQLNPKDPVQKTKKIVYGLPKSLLSISATQEPIKQQTKTMSQVIVTFTRDPSDPTFAGVNIWFTGYNGNPNPQLMKGGTDSPIIFECEATGETVTVHGQLVGQSGITQDISKTAICTVKLNGQKQAPPAPSISQSLIGTATGYQFSFNQIPAIVNDVIDGYAIYRNTTGALDGTQARIQYKKHNPTNLGATVVTDTIVDAVGVFYYYWVSAIDTAGRESVKMAAQSGAVAGSLGSIPPSQSGTVLNGFTWTTDTSSVTFSWSTTPIYRADNTIMGTVTAGTQAVTGLQANQGYFAYPYWDESTQAMKWLSTEVVFPTITSVALNGSTGYVKTTNGFSMPSAFTIEAWVNIGTGAGTYGVMDVSNPQAAGAGTTGVAQLWIAAGVVYFAMQNTVPAWNTINTSGGTGWTNINDSNWHHIVVTYTGGTATIYVDNAVFATSAAMGTINATSGYVHIGVVDGFAGAGHTTQNWLTGNISNVALYPSALTAAQISNHFVMGVNVGFVVSNSYDSIVTADLPTYFWKLREPSGTSAADSAGSNTGTYTGGFTLNQQARIVIPQGTPAYMWPYKTFIATQAQTLRNRIPLSSGSINPSTTSAGTGGGSGGGGGGGGRGGCFSGNTRVVAQRGAVAIKDIVEGDLVLTAKETWRPVKKVIAHAKQPWLAMDMGGGEFVTIRHRVLSKDRWQPAFEVLSGEVMEITAEVYDLEVETDEPETFSGNCDTEHSYTLENGLVVHNVYYGK